MAIPTDFKGYTPAAGATKTFKIFGTATVGIWGNDVDGTFTPSVVNLAPNMALFMGAVYTDAQIIAAMQDFLRRMGAFHEGAAGGYVVEASKQIALTSTVTA